MSLGCEACGAVAKTRWVDIHRHIGMLVMMQHGSIKGNLCKNCINKYFWEYTLTTGVVGWWGMISFFITPCVLVNNVVRYLTALSLPAPKGSLGPREIVEQTLPKLERHFASINNDLSNNRPLEAIAQDLAAREGVPSEWVHFTLVAMLRAAAEPQE